MVACTATATAEGVQDITAYLHTCSPHVIRMTVVKENLHICITETGSSVQAEVSLVRLLRLSRSPTVLVFCSERIECERVTRLLVKNSLNAEAYHGGISDREAVEKRTREGMPYSYMARFILLLHV
jgi:superfamily II DNA helicase RecQ